jgi:hypothetical protein
VAQLYVGGDDVRIHLGLLGRIGAFVGGDGSVPLAAIRSVRVTEDPWSEVRGVRSPGVGLGRMVALGTRRHQFGKDFVAVYGKGPAVVIDLAGQSFSRLVISSSDAERVAEEIRSAVDEARMPRPAPE